MIVIIDGIVIVTIMTIMIIIQTFDSYNNNKYNGEK